jgi:hypothetical protein
MSAADISKGLKLIESSLSELGAPRPIVRVVLTHRAMRRLEKSLDDITLDQVGDGNVSCEINGITVTSE